MLMSPRDPALHALSAALMRCPERCPDYSDLDLMRYELILIKFE